MRGLRSKAGRPKQASGGAIDIAPLSFNDLVATSGAIDGRLAAYKSSLDSVKLRGRMGNIPQS